MFLPEASIIAYAGPAGSAIMKLVSKNARALASAILMFAFMGIGFSVGPLAAGIISDALKPTLHADSLKWALAGLAVLRVWGSGHYLAAAKAYAGDLKLNDA
jgi:MFS family permease